MVKSGPQPMTHEARQALAHEIANQIHAHYGESVLAIGLYGSLARGTDGPYSDIEMWCVMRGEEIDYAHEWTDGPWKAEVNILSADVIQQNAAELDGDWAMTHGSYVHILPLYDPDDFFPTLNEKVFAHSAEVFDAIIRSVIVGEIYEIVGKIRNISFSDVQNESSFPPMLPFYTVSLTRYGAWMIGLANRHLYTSASVMLTESLARPNCPVGYDVLCRLVMSGNLTDPVGLLTAAEAFWAGVGEWARKRGIRIEQSLDELLN